MWEVMQVNVKHGTFRGETSDLEPLSNVLEDGWEPFAVTANITEYCYHLRKRKTPSYIPGYNRSYVDARREAAEDIEQRLDKLEADLKNIVDR